MGDSKAPVNPLDWYQARKKKGEERMVTFTLDKALQPREMTCITCRGKMTVYPCPIPTGTGFCPTCSPAWLESFAKFMMNEERKKRNLKPV